MQSKKSNSTSVTEFLVIKLVFIPTELQLEQEEYIDKTLKRFSMSECKSCSTPLEVKCTLAYFTNSELFKGPFRELIGALLYLAVTTRRDILFTVNCFSQLQEKPTAAAWTQKDLKVYKRY
ncbi:hypothetical protein AVEN_160168-1 [Araneus ventricosus]|nr:hypothetical protein AVEN_160168-1 [Araneus ventricosus]